jgi:predicted nucleic acid-binding protein
LILLDTTVLVYAVGGDHPLREPCRRIIKEVGAGTTAATTTVEVIQEFAHVRARRRGRAAASALSRQFIDLLSPLVQPEESDLIRGLDMFERHDALGSFDAILAAIVLGRDHLSGLMSADRAFSAIPGLIHLDPGSAQ